MTTESSSPRGDDSLLPPGQSLKDDFLAIHILLEGLGKLAFDEIANKATYQEKAATAAEYRMIYQNAYDSVLFDRAGGSCPFGQHKCNGVCTSDPCLDLSQ